MTSTILKVTFTVFCLLFFYAIIAKISHANNADTFLAIGLISFFCCLAFALFEIFTSRRIESTEKMIWALCLFTIGWPVMLYYVFAKRKNIINSSNGNLRTI